MAAPDSLHATGHGQRVDAGGEPTRDRPADEDDDPCDEDASPTALVGQARARHDEHAHGEAVGGHHPLQALLADVEIASGCRATRR